MDHLEPVLSDSCPLLVCRKQCSFACGVSEFAYFFVCVLDSVWSTWCLFCPIPVILCQKQCSFPCGISEFVSQIF